MIDRWIVVAAGVNEEGEPVFTPLATCLSPEDAEHFAATCIGDDVTGFVLPVSSREWVHPAFAEVAQVTPSEEGT